MMMTGLKIAVYDVRIYVYKERPGRRHKLLPQPGGGRWTWKSPLYLKIVRKKKKRRLEEKRQLYKSKEKCPWEIDRMTRDVHRGCPSSVLAELEGAGVELGLGDHALLDGLGRPGASLRHVPHAALGGARRAVQV